MTTRGRLIFPVRVELARIDVEATRADSGFDDVLGQPRLAAAPGLPAKGNPRGEIATKYFLPVRVLGQIENGLARLTTYQQGMVQTGNQPKLKLQIVYHYAELEQAGLVSADGHVKMRSGDRLLAAYKLDGVQICTFEDAYATRVDDTSFGLSAQNRNLCVMTYESRAKGNAAP
jgi:hypothetical protein